MTGGAVPADDVTLAGLHRSGRLAASYPRVPGLLADLPDDELTRAGHLLARLDPDEVLRHHPSTPVLTVAVTGHSTLGPLVPPLTAELARHGMLARPRLSDFDGYVFDLGDPGSALYAAGPDLVLCVLDPDIVFDEVPVPWTVADVERTLDAKVALVRGLAAACHRRTDATLVLNTLPLPRRFTAQLVDHRSRARLGAAWRAANARLLTLGEEFPSVVTLDLDPLLAEGIAAEDPRLGRYAGMGLSPALLARYAREIGHLARHLTGRGKKALVCDLDGTLWGGVLGDDGPDGVEVGEGPRGAAFTAFQKVVRQLGSQGVLLAVVSKNDPGPVDEALREHPRMTLRPADLVRVAASWRPKPDGIAELARDLNLGADSFVFVDDSAYECGLVRHALPEVTVVRLDEEPALHVDRLLRDGWFDTRELNAEDRARPARYREELGRQSFLDSFDSIADYLSELGVWVRLAPVTEAEIPRAAQLTLRTNQFHTAVRRLQPAQVSALAAGPGTRVLGISSGDRFGDNGMVGLIVTRAEGGVLRIDNFVLSCRVFSRGIETACLAAVLADARATGAGAVEAVYRPGPRNAGVRDLYPDHGFVPAGEEDGALLFRHDLADVAAPPPHIRFVESLEETH
ncbi:HAD-IIIC family phosphatase [Actinomadura kijaniata]|uniref:FkbH-like protein n=1 Tax=Actinomadura kijaniata TaxID=46161 RepID=B3TMQ2_ACTKI|nr:HAD-IIIC family phosphatase [Actinomadura kijaniata]ACB46482.1 FkbH-like protein [Actinomadura kijaniata]